jgi:hypothetical protein
MPQHCICNNRLVNATLGNEDAGKQDCSGHRWTNEVRLPTATGIFLFATTFRPPRALYEVDTSNLIFVV